MAVLLEPKLDFMRDTAAREKHSQIVSDPLVHRTMAVTLAEMHVRGLAPDAMRGVMLFIDAWMNLGEQNPVPRPMPTKHLQSFGQPTTVKTVTET